MSSAALAPADPFCSAADPARYVPRAATEQALAELCAALAAGPSRPLALTGPPGIGKSLLVQVLVARLGASYTFVCLQATPPSTEQVCESALHVLGVASLRDAAARLGREAEARAQLGRPLVLVLDSVEVLSREVLAELVKLGAGVLRLLLVASEREGLDEDLAGLGGELQRVRLAAPLSRSETEAYLRARLEASAAPPELRMRLLDLALDLWRRSRGNPQGLHAEVSQIQLELWREQQQAAPLVPLEASSGPAALVRELHVEEPVEAPDPVSVEVGGLEVDAELAPVDERLARAPQAETAREDPAQPRDPRRWGRGVYFLLGALTGATLTSALFVWMGRGGEPGEHSPAAIMRPANPVRVNVQALPWATIYVDGRLAGETPLGDLAVVPGLREFRAEMSDGRKLIKRVQVAEGTRVVFQ